MENKLSSPLSVLKGAGPRRCALLEKLGLRTVQDLLWFFPRRYEDHRDIRKISELVPGASSVVFASVMSCEARSLAGGGRRMIRCRLSDGSGELEALWFNRKGLEHILKEAVPVLLCGIPTLRSGTFEMTEPDFEIVKGDWRESSFLGIIPVYPSTEGLPKRWFRETALAAVREYSPLLEDILPPSLIEKNRLLPLSEAVRQMHAPDAPESWKEARRRVVYEELFTLQLSLAAAREKNSRGSAPPTQKGALFAAMLERLPFTLTESQKKVIDELISEGAKGQPLARLIQGDVGCGKTAVAAALAAAVCDGGAQCAILAPTEVLAEQLREQMKKYLPLTEAECALLKASLPARERRSVLKGLEDGSVKIVAGTQALLSEGISFRRLGALIIDEQQRFGVRQRARLLQKEESPHLIMMSATPIPRTMALTLYGDLDISLIEGCPSGRPPVETRIIGGEQLEKLLRFIAEETLSGGRVYWICPRVEEDGPSCLPAAVKRFQWLRKKLPPVRTALIHGQMESGEKEAAISAFRDGKASILVGTTVLEVGVDVPEATVIVIEAPERYGLSQLHQLRGRIGRGKRRGVCLLLSRQPEDAERLKIFAATNDGFEIARSDLELRGAGELAGTAQHGSARFKAADLRRDWRLAELAAKEAREFLAAEGLAALHPSLREKIDKEEQTTIS
ncbi:MAG: ATP-dependent DNA helicase RecG [Synergistaceae bacterium]|nr:ATP-dependent DNA helicase RecG [Synergistaceae bacterium]